MDAYIAHLQTKAMKPYMVDIAGNGFNNADAVPNPASYYIGSTLVARKPVNLMSSPDEKSTLLQAFPKGANVGKIYSYVIRNGFVWWSVDWFSGKHAGFVKHEPGLFSAPIAEETSSGLAIATKKVEQAKAEAETIGAKTLEAGKAIITGTADVVTGVGKTLSSLGGNLRWIIIGVLCFAVLAFIIVNRPRQ